MASTANCPNVLANGSCDDEACGYNHQILNCEVCTLVFSSETEYQVHLTSDKHHNRVSGSSIASYCRICLTNIPGGQSPWNQHVMGRKHLAQAATLRIPPSVEPQMATSTSRETFCELCQTMIPNFALERHLKNPRHTSRQVFARYKTAVEEAEADKHDVTIEGVFDFGVVAPHTTQGGIQKTATIRTTQPFTKCTLLSFKLASSQGARPFSSGFTVAHQSGSNTLSSRPLVLSVTFKQAHIGRYEDRLELVFRDTQLGQQFIITRTIKAVVGDKALHEQLKPKKPYIPRARSARKEITEVVEGVKPPALNAIQYVAALPKAGIPVPLRNLLEGSESIGRISKQLKSAFLPVTLNNKTYGRFFKHLLWIEESKMEQDLEKYDIPNAVLRRHNQYYYLDVPGLAEKRPSVLVGDRILVQEQGITDGRWFEGHVHVVRKVEVGLCFHTSFGRYSEGRRFHVRFKLSRIPLRRQHQAMDTVFVEDRVLFPLVSHLAAGRLRTSRDVRLNLYNDLIAKNALQLQAVVSIVSLPPGSPPFVVFGPPGTGKTITIVEAIRQVLSHNPEARILACAPSNSAADLIASRLRGPGGLSPQELFRFYAPSRHKDNLPDELRSYSYIGPDGHFALPSPARVRLSSFRVVVTTCLSASIAHGIGMRRGFFTHIFIDEAGQATEPEVFVSIKTMADPKTNVVLSGDPKQLGPIIRSGIAVGLGLEQSYLERLMNREAYDLETGYGKSVVKLTKNFRSHNAILKFSNEKFYGGDLQQCADATTINYYLDSTILPSKKFPIIFHAVSGKDEREASSPSFFNTDEVAVVRSYVEKLKENRKLRTADVDIGVIAPYHSQCKKLRVALNQMATTQLKVGSVEEFQGQERKVIIISTVRSSKEFVEYDLRHTLGFVANPRRFNVAVTRAKALLIVVGDPNVLSLDPLWRTFLNYIYINGGWTGPDIPWDPSVPVDENGGYDKTIREAAKIDMNEFTRRLENMTMAEIEDEIDANVDRPWRDLE